MGMMLKNLVHPYIQSTTVLCDMQKYLPFIIYYGSALLLFIRKLHLQTFEHMSALWAIKAWVFVISTRVFEILRETYKRYFN